MGIGVQALLLMKMLRENGHLTGRSTVIELGSQQFAPDLATARRAIGGFFPDISPDRIHVPRNLYASLGMDNYTCIDLDGANNALVFNLNEPLDEVYDYQHSFDLVTNHGTTEHAFNQLQCFTNVHKLTNVGGLMIHALPSQGYQNHAFFNYHPSFYMDLASANNYEILGLFYNVGEELIPYTDDYLMMADTRATEDLAVFAVLQKRSKDAFVVPFDGRYYFEQDGKDFKPRSDVGSHSRVETNTFPLSRGRYAPGKGESSASIKIVVPVWGESFARHFVNFSLRQQLESGLLEIDERANIEYLIMTDSVGAYVIRESEMYKKLCEIVQIQILSNDHLVGQATYSRLTESYNLALARAKYNDLYIFMTSDCFFSNEVLRRIKAKAEKHRVILAPALRVVEESFVADVTISNSYDLDGRGVLALAMRHEHPLTEAFCINNRRRALHPLPAQTLVRLPSGYVGRWNVMHPIAIKIGNIDRRVDSTIDHRYPLFHIRDWSDVGILDTIDDGLIVSLTPFSYDQGEKIRYGNSQRSCLNNLKVWVTIPWALDFHIAQISHPIRLLGSEEDRSEIENAERNVDRIISKFLKYVNSRKTLKRESLESSTVLDLIRPAIDRRQRRLRLGRFARGFVRRIAPSASRISGYIGRKLS